MCVFIVYKLYFILSLSSSNIKGGFLPQVQASNTTYLMSKISYNSREPKYKYKQVFIWYFFFQLILSWIVTPIWQIKKYWFLFKREFIFFTVFHGTHNIVNITLEQPLNIHSGENWRTLVHFNLTIKSSVSIWPFVCKITKEPPWMHITFFLLCVK